ncbi:MAG TPA: hypothetical protein VGI97_14655 [Gemmatimonadaceae bacterium]|jgi:hypothetical protein
MPETIASVDMNPMATRFDLLEAASLVHALCIILPKVTPLWTVHGTACPFTEAGMLNLERRLRGRAAEFDTRPAPCSDCHIRHTPSEGCFDGR